MAMDFFEHQEVARKKTGLLVFYFVLAVILIIVTVYLAFALAFLLGEGGGPGSQAGGLWDGSLFAAVTLGTLALVGGGSAYRVASLSGGGRSVAEILGGRLLSPDTRDPDERRLLNVVEEMAIASGTPVPPVYLMDQEAGINAFAAGFAPTDAVIGVTQGAMRILSRDELQGVIAHEFSHILNGDMRLNIRLMGLLYGILLISTIGWILFRSTAHQRPRRRSDGEKKGTNPLPFLGLALYVIGYVGVIFGRLIKAAVSRQREYLADASAVQFTRNPDGIAGALKKIGALSGGSKIANPEAEEASHMFFGEALGLSALNPMATHPPLVDRIRRIDPSFDGDFSKVSLAPPSHRKVEPPRPAPSTARGARPGAFPFNPADAITQIGTLGPQNLAFASALLEAIPNAVQSQIREPFGACALVYGLLLDESPNVRQDQLEILSRSAPPEVFRELQQVMPGLADVAPEARLPLVELAVPALRRLSPEQFRAFVENLRHLMEADQQVSLFEYALRRLLLRHLGPQFGWGQQPTVRHSTVAPLVEPTATLLSAFAHVGQTDPAEQERAYVLGTEALGWSVALPNLLPVEKSGLEDVDAALKILADATPNLKKAVLTASATTIGADGTITLEEGELLRAIADALDCPMPPLMMGSSSTNPVAQA